MDTVTHEAPAMFLADMLTTDEDTVDFRRLAVRLVGQRLNAAMEMTAEGLERLPRAQAQDRRRRDQAQDPPGTGRAATSPARCSGPTPAPTARWWAR